MIAPQGLEKGESYCENAMKHETSSPLLDPNFFNCPNRNSFIMLCILKKKVKERQIILSEFKTNFATLNSSMNSCISRHWYNILNPQKEIQVI